MQSWTLTGYFSNTTGSYVTNCRFSLITGAHLSSHASFIAQSSCSHLRGNASPLGTDVTIHGHLSHWAPLASEGPPSINRGITKVTLTWIFVILTGYCHIGSQWGRVPTHMNWTVKEAWEGRGGAHANEDVIWSIALFIVVFVFISGQSWLIWGPTRVDSICQIHACHFIFDVIGGWWVGGGREPLCTPIANLSSSNEHLFLLFSLYEWISLQLTWMGFQTTNVRVIWIMYAKL